MSDLKAIHTRLERANTRLGRKYDKEETVRMLQNIADKHDYTLEQAATWFRRLAENTGEYRRL